MTLKGFRYTYCMDCSKIITVSVAMNEHKTSNMIRTDYYMLFIYKYMCITYKKSSNASKVKGESRLT
jgi:hypothetical protein